PQVYVVHVRRHLVLHKRILPVDKTPSSEAHTLSLHDALPICKADAFPAEEHLDQIVRGHQHQHRKGEQAEIAEEPRPVRILVHVDRKSTRLNSSHGSSSYSVFCLKKKTIQHRNLTLKMISHYK